MNLLQFCAISILLLFSPSVCQAQASYDDSETLYYPGDNVTIFHAGNLKQTLTSSSTMWLVEYYSSWCGHCHEFAPVYKALARDISGWAAVIKLAVLNCVSKFNDGVCHSVEVYDRYPTIMFYPSKSDENNKGELLDETNLVQMKDYRNEILKYIETNLPSLEWNRDTPKPVLSPVSTIAEIEQELNNFKSGSTEYLALIFENEGSSMGKEIILDMSSCKNISLRSITHPSEASSHLTTTYNITLDEGGPPHIAVVTKNNGSVINIDVKMKTRYFYVYKLERLAGVGDPVAKEEVVLKDDDLSNPVFSSDLLDRQQVNVEELDRRYVYLADIESALRYALTKEATSVQVMDGKKMEAMKTFIGALAKLGTSMPGRHTTANFFIELDGWLQDKTSVSFEEWGDRMNLKTNSSFLPPTDSRWVGCLSEVSNLRKYPCGLWTLFHTMSVASYNAGYREHDLVFNAMKAYILNFFSCRNCRENFEKEIQELELFEDDHPYQSVLWLWRLHNSVNQRLHNNSATEDAKFPKLQFPTREDCSFCSDEDGNFVKETTAQFLIRYFSARNFRWDYIHDLQVPTPIRMLLFNRGYGVTKLPVKSLKSMRNKHAP